MLRILFSCLSVLVLPLSAALEGTKPNIILMMTDDQGFAQQACHGHPWIKTPNLDKLHGQSTRFTTFMVAPTCSPTRAAIMSGRHPEKNGITHTILERDRMALGTVTLPQVLKKAGYTSGIFGKWHLGDEAAYQPEKRGFDEVFVHGAGGIGQAFKCSNADAPGNKYFDPAIRHNGKFVKTKGYCTDIFFKQALGWIKEKSETKQPFFAYISTNAPHGPFIAPPKNTKRFTDLGFHKTPAGYYGMIENIDENMGLLMAKLDEWGISENTVLVFMSDNGTTANGAGIKKGEMLAEGYKIYNGGMKGYKGSTDEGGSKVPFFIRWPGKFKAGAEVDTLAAHIDILPTFAALAGAEIPAQQVEGRSLLPLMNDQRDVDWADRYIFNHICRWPTGADPDEFKDVNYSVRNQRFRLVAPQKSRRSNNAKPALFDMERDPSQKTDVIDQYPEIAAGMVAAFQKYWKEARPLMVNEEAPMSPVRPYHVWYKEQLENGGIPAWQEPKF
ncbi:MAG: arylsulfatase [Akkermansiaceae bacterium]